MLVTKKQFRSVLNQLEKPGVYGLDTETTGLKASDRLFSIIIAAEKEVYYFDFNDGTLPRGYLKKFVPVFTNQESIWCLHNAKFDMGMLAKEDLYLKGMVHCTMALERVLRNDYFIGKPYSLEACAKRRGAKKDTAVED